MSNYIVSGATGFIGRNLIDCLIDKEEKVTVIVREESEAVRLWGRRVHIIEQDLVDSGSLKISDFCYSIEESIVVHFAWEGTSGDKRSREATQLNNVKISCEFMRRMRELGCKRFINAGSIMEYEAIKTIATDGEHPQRNSIYSIAKLSADFMMKTIAADIDMEYVNVIISNIYGPGEKSKRFLNNVVRGMIKNEDLILTEGLQLYDFIYTTDAMEMIYAVAEKGKPFESYYIGNSHQRPLREFVVEVKNVLNSSSDLLFGAAPFLGQALDYTEFDCGKVETELGVIPSVSFEDGIRRTRDSILSENN